MATVLTSLGFLRLSFKKWGEDMVLGHDDGWHEVIPGLSFGMKSMMEDMLEDSVDEVGRETAEKINSNILVVMAFAERGED